jgi:hypothetical protein
MLLSVAESGISTKSPLEFKVTYDESVRRFVPQRKSVVTLPAGSIVVTLRCLDVEGSKRTLVLDMIKSMTLWSTFSSREIWSVCSARSRRLRKDAKISSRCWVKPLAA